MKQFAFGLLLFASATGAFSSCKDSSKIPAPDVISAPLFFPQVSSDKTKNHFDYGSARAPEASNPVRPVFEFTIDLKDQRDVKIKAVEVYKSFKRGNTIGPRALAGSYSTFPVTISLNSQQVLTDLKRLTLQNPIGGLPQSTLSDTKASSPTATNGILTGDVIIFTFEYVLEDDSRIILTPLTSVPLLAPSPPAQVISGGRINAPYALYDTIRT
jgi:hypothetical protein